MQQIIEIAGTPSSGKTSLCNYIARRLRETEISMHVSIAGMDSTPTIIPKTIYQYDIWQSCELAQLLLETGFKDDEKVTILDRGIFDQICWLDRFVNDRSMSAKERLVSERFTSSPTLYKNIDYVLILLTSNHDVAISRGKNPNGLVGEDTHRILLDAYNNRFSEFRLPAEKFRKFHIETDTLSRSETAEKFWCWM